MPSTTSSNASWTAMAAALPMKIPDGSSPDSRNASRPPSAASMAKLRWMARRAEKTTATQKRPGAALVRKPRSGSRAKAKTINTNKAYGATWLVATRERNSTRRSFPATSAASRNTQRLPTDDGRGLHLHLAARHGHDSMGQRAGPLERVRREQHGFASGRPLAHQGVEQIAAVGVEAGVGLVEQPELGSS